MADAIVAEGLRKSFGKVEAVAGLDLRVRRGTVFGLLGPNGAGKTTTIHLLLGLLRPDAGRAGVAGIDVAANPGEVRRRCGALLEHNGLYERLSPLENLTYVASLYGMPKAEAHAAAKSALDGMGLWGRRDDRTGTWSKGMKQRLAIARALVHSPEVVFLDEPTNGFDPRAAGELRAALRSEARQRGLTVFLTTHNLREAQQLCDHVAVLRAGKVLAHGPPDQLVRRAPTLTIHADKVSPAALAALGRKKGVQAVSQDGGLLRVELAAPEAGAAVVAHLVKAGALVHEVRRERADLERDVALLLAEAA